MDVESETYINAGKISRNILQKKKMKSNESV